MELNTLNDKELLEFLKLSEMDIEFSTPYYLSMLSPQEAQTIIEKGTIHPCIDMVMTKVFLLQQIEREAENRDLLKDYRRFAWYIDYELLRPTVYRSYENRVQHLLHLKTQGFLELDFVQAKKDEFAKLLQEAAPSDIPQA